MYSIQPVNAIDFADLMNQIGDSLSFGFRDMTQYKFEIDLILKYKDQLLQFDQCTKEDIYNIWTNDVFCTENDPEYMVKKFKQDRNDPVIFYSSTCLVEEQRYLLNKYFPNASIENMCRITEFLKWTRYMLGGYDIKSLSADDKITELWRNSTVSVFFFGLTLEMQTKLVNKYNSGF